MEDKCTRLPRKQQNNAKKLKDKNNNRKIGKEGKNGKDTEENSDKRSTFAGTQTAGRGSLENKKTRTTPVKFSMQAKIQQKKKEKSTEEISYKRVRLKNANSWERNPRKISQSLKGRAKKLT